jgi:hypothetical protein
MNKWVWSFCFYLFCIYSAKFVIIYMFLATCYNAKIFLRTFKKARSSVHIVPWLHKYLLLLNTYNLLVTNYCFWLLVIYNYKEIELYSNFIYRNRTTKNLTFFVKIVFRFIISTELGCWWYRNKYIKTILKFIT